MIVFVKRTFRIKLTVLLKNLYLEPLTSNNFFRRCGIDGDFSRFVIYDGVSKFIPIFSSM